MFETIVTAKRKDFYGLRKIFLLEIFFESGFRNKFFNFEIAIISNIFKQKLASLAI